VIFTGPRARRNQIIVMLLTALLFLAGATRPVKVVRDTHSDSVIWLWAWQECRVSFINSITSLPVEIRFSAPWSFSGFSVTTDQVTEDYYTAGQFSWNEQMAKEQTKLLTYCSEVGIEVTLGGKHFHEQGGCTRLELLWPP